MAFEPGQQVADYEIIARLGAGGLGVVYEVRHLISQRREAMKILLPDQTDTPEMVERFRREVQTLATLNHVNIAALHTAFYLENQLAMVMELVPGDTVRDRQRRGEIPLDQVLDVAFQTLDALNYAHQLGVVHRDVKPSNIMITKSGVVKLLDFGIARTEHSADLTKTGFLVGSLHYMSPEIIRGQKATPASDIYSLGVTLYELLTGRLPITGASNYEIMMGHIERIPLAPTQIHPAIPVSISDAILRALEKLPEKRFPSASRFLEALKASNPTAGHQVSAAAGSPTFLFGSPISSRSSNPPEQPAAKLGNVASDAAQSSKPQSGSGFPNLELEDLSRKLAVYIGPVAKFVVKKLAGQHEDLDTLYREAAKQISSESDRAQFLRSRNR